MEVGLGPERLCVRWGPRSHLLKFTAHVNCGQTAGWIKIVLGTEVGLSPGDLVVLDVDPAPSPNRGRAPPLNFWPISIVAKRLDAPRCHLVWSPQFSAHFYCHQTAGCIKMPLGMEVGLSAGDFVLDGGPSFPSPKRAQSPNFRPMFVVAKRHDGLRWHLVWR